MLLGEGRRRAANSRHHREQTRVAAHIARAEQFAHENKTAVESLDPLRSLVRSLLLDALREYREEGVFPENHRRPCNTPVFVDEKGTHCAVGHLLALSGHGALVEKIATERNLATVYELSNEPELVAWLDATGLTLEEAALIQPGYGYCGSAAQCFCAPYRQPFEIPNHATSGNVVGVLGGDMIGTTQLRVTHTFGNVSGHSVGEVVEIRAFHGEPGARALVALDERGSQPIPTGYYDAATLGYVAVGVRADGSGTCSFLRTSALSAPTIVDAWLSPSCFAYLTREAPQTAERVCTNSGGCACTIPSRAPREAPSHATLSILLSLVAALVVRRSRRRDRQRPR